MRQAATIKVLMLWREVSTKGLEFLSEFLKSILRCQKSIIIFAYLFRIRKFGTPHQKLHWFWQLIIFPSEFLFPFKLLRLRRVKFSHPWSSSQICSIENIKVKFWYLHFYFLKLFNTCFTTINFKNCPWTWKKPLYTI